MCTMSTHIDIGRVICFTGTTFNDLYRAGFPVPPSLGLLHLRLLTEVLYQLT